MSLPTVLEPDSGDTAALAARKSNQILFNTYADAIGAGPFPGGLTTLAPARNDSLTISLKKINAILGLSSPISQADLDAALAPINSRLASLELRVTALENPPP